MKKKRARFPVGARLNRIFFRGLLGAYTSWSIGIIVSVAGGIEELGLGPSNSITATLLTSKVALGAMSWIILGNSGAMKTIGPIMIKVLGWEMDVASTFDPTRSLVIYNIRDPVINYECSSLHRVLYDAGLLHTNSGDRVLDFQLGKRISSDDIILSNDRITKSDLRAQNPHMFVVRPEPWRTLCCNGLP